MYTSSPDRGPNKSTGQQCKGISVSECLGLGSLTVFLACCWHRWTVETIACRSWCWEGPEVNTRKTSWFAREVWEGSRWPQEGPSSLLSCSEKLRVTSLKQTNQVTLGVMGQYHLYSRITILFLTTISLTHTQCWGHHLLVVNLYRCWPWPVGSAIEWYPLEMCSLQITFTWVWWAYR